MNLRHVLYISNAPALRKTEIAEIVEQSQRNNMESGITGFLLYNGRNFMQLVEGEGRDLRGLLQRLSRDKRHSGIVHLVDQPAAQRACEGWAMKGITLGKSIPERRDALENALPQSLMPDVRNLALNFAALN